MTKMDWTKARRYTPQKRMIPSGEVLKNLDKRIAAEKDQRVKGYLEWVAKKAREELWDAMKIMNVVKKAPANARQI